jgi:hypothetical protein
LDVIVDALQMLPVWSSVLKVLKIHHIFVKIVPKGFKKTVTEPYCWSL